MEPEEKDPEILKEWRENPKYWKWGIFYYNKADNRILPPKPNPMMGVTINFAQRGSVLFFVVMMAFFAFVIIMIETHKTVNSQSSGSAVPSRRH